MDCQSGGQTSISDYAKEECNNSLHKVGLEIVSVVSLHITSILEVTMRQTDLWHGITICRVSVVSLHITSILEVTMRQTDL